VCGIVGLFSKSTQISGQLGRYLGAMLVQMAERGPDSAGVAIYRNSVPVGSTKVSLFAEDPRYGWDALCDEMHAALGGEGDPEARVNHALVVVGSEAAVAVNWLRLHHPELRIMSAGEAIEIYKEQGNPEEFVTAFRLAELAGSHALGHTRMATESRVTTEHSHPFSTGLDLCLVHNGSLSNHNDLRRELIRHGIHFDTDNDTEVAAGYLTWQLAQGASLEHALESCLDALDGFYTFAVGARDGFAVLRDPFACKPAVIAETDEWVAMASEYRAIAILPGASNAAVWEPAPGVLYSWRHAALVA
jgi:glutamate synthase domain-containing protein 1